MTWWRALRDGILQGLMLGLVLTLYIGAYWTIGFVVLEAEAHQRIDQIIRDRPSRPVYEEATFRDV